MALIVVIIPIVNEIRAIFIKKIASYIIFNYKYSMCIIRLIRSILVTFSFTLQSFSVCMKLVNQIVIVLIKSRIVVKYSIKINLKYKK